MQTCGEVPVVSAAELSGAYISIFKESRNSGRLLTCTAKAGKAVDASAARLAGRLNRIAQ